MTKKILFLQLLTFGLLMLSCTSKESSEAEETQPKDTMDTHSFSQPDVASTRHLELDLTVDFNKKQLTGFARHHLEEGYGDTLILDTRSLAIDKVTAGKEEREAEFSFTDSKRHMGKGLIIPLEEGDSIVTVYYHTTDGADALDWLAPAQTADRTHPFLYTQGQAILTRTWIPLQDSPGVRFTYEATMRVPEDMMAVMSAENPTTLQDDGVYHFTMNQPIPGYLMALAVGKLAFGEIGPRTGIYAEPSMLEAALYEFADMEKMLETAEGLYGKYLWDRYDMIILPPSFPFGGMENPRLTFATPTIIAGDRSLTALVAHELAHSWSGNLVTNATWNDFWLNEGFTVYFESRIMEELYGREYTEMLQQLGYQDLEGEVEELREKDTHLYLDLENRDPDDGMTNVAYEKGALFLRVIESKVGREKLDAFLSTYFDENKFHSMTTARFLEYLDNQLLKPNNADIDVDAWVYGPGIPDSAIKVESSRFEAVDAQAKAFLDAESGADLQTGEWSTHEWLHFLRQLPANLDSNRMEALDEAYQLSDSGNSEILAEWLTLSIKTGYIDQNMDKLEAFLIRVGRRKFLTPLYRALIENDRKEKAREIFERAKENYHSVSRNSIAELL